MSPARQKPRQALTLRGEPAFQRRVYECSGPRAQAREDRVEDGVLGEGASPDGLSAIRGGGMADRIGGGGRNVQALGQAALLSAGGALETRENSRGVSIAALDVQRGVGGWLAATLGGLTLSRIREMRPPGTVWRLSARFRTRKIPKATQSLRLIPLSRISLVFRRDIHAAIRISDLASTGNAGCRQAKRAAP